MALDQLCTQQTDKRSTFVSGSDSFRGKVVYIACCIYQDFIITSNCSFCCVTNQLFVVICLSLSSDYFQKQKEPLTSFQRSPLLSLHLCSIKVHPLLFFSHLPLPRIWQGSKGLIITMLSYTVVRNNVKNVPTAEPQHADCSNY